MERIDFSNALELNAEVIFVSRELQILYEVLRENPNYTKDELNELMDICEGRKMKMNLLLNNLRKWVDDITFIDICSKGSYFI